jgi:hypothetical protein
MLKERRVHLEAIKRKKARKLTQKFLGLILIVLSAIILYFCAKGNTVQDSDATPVLFTLPLGLYMLFSREDCLM